MHALTYTYLYASGNGNKAPTSIHHPQSVINQTSPY